MFPSVARLRHVSAAALLFLPFAHGRLEELFTSSVSYCAEPDTLLVQRFDLAYIAHNSTIFFNISAASVTPDVNVTANLQLNIYGIHAFNYTLDLCDLFGGALCPLPQYNFTGSDWIPLPDSVDVASHIPQIAYKIPDLEAFAQLTLTEVSSGETKACLQATLSTGWSMRQSAVSWATGALALLALLSATWQSFNPYSLAPVRLLDYMYLLQTIAMSGFLNLNYSYVYRSFTQNFSWAMGLFPQSIHSSMQASINHMRSLTGGDGTDGSGGGSVALVNRKLSPYNAESYATSYSSPLGSVSGSTLAKFSSLPQMDFMKGMPSLPSLSRRVAEDVSEPKVLAQVETVTSTSDNVLQAGIPIYANSVGVATANAYMTVFFVALILIAITIGALAIGYGIVYALSRRGKGPRGERFNELREQYAQFARAWGLRIAFVCLTPVLIFTFYQWTLNDSWLSILLSVFLLLALAAYVLWPVFTTMRLARRTAPYALYQQPQHLTTYGPLYAPYREPRYYFFIPLIVAAVLKSLFIAFSKANGEVQVIVILIIEVAVLISLIALKPFHHRGGDVLATFLAVIRVLCAGLMIAFITNVGVAAIPRVGIGIGIALVYAIAVIVLFVNILLHLGVQRLWQKKNKQTASSSAEASILEKGGQGEKDGSALWGARPGDQPESHSRQPSDAPSSSSHHGSPTTYDPEDNRFSFTHSHGFAEPSSTSHPAPTSSYAYNRQLSG